MTDRVKGYVVTLEKDLRVDDAELVTQAIMMIRNVVAVEPVLADHNDLINRTRVRHEMRKRLWEALEVESP